jgi:hypothetical protein
MSSQPCDADVLARVRAASGEIDENTGVRSTVRTAGEQLTAQPQRALWCRTGEPGAPKDRPVELAGLDEMIRGELIPRTVFSAANGHQTA